MLFMPGKKYRADFDVAGFLWFLRNAADLMEDLLNLAVDYLISMRVYRRHFIFKINPRFKDEPPISIFRGMSRDKVNSGVGQPSERELIAGLVVEAIEKHPFAFVLRKFFSDRYVLATEGSSVVIGIALSHGEVTTA